MVIGLYHKGRYKVRAMRLVLKLLAGNNSEKRIKLARKLFPKHCQHHVSKGFESGTRTRELEDLSLADKFAVPKESYHSFTASNFASVILVSALLHEKDLVSRDFLACY